MATKFEEIGAEMQFAARNPWQAEKLFEKSCKACVTRGMKIECERCHIDAAHKFIMEYRFGRKPRDEEA